MDAGRELDALVAEKVMGFNKVTEIVVDHEPPHELYRAPDGRGYYPNRIPLYSTSIADAWQVVEKLAREGKHLALQAPGSLDMNECYRRFKQWTADFTYDIDSEGRADTAPLAICLAALKAVGYHFDRKELNP